MIKSWQQFNESKIHFEESDEYRNLKYKYSIKKEDIKDFLDDLSDETDFQFRSVQNFIKNITDNSFVLVTHINLFKRYKNPKGFKEYQDYLKLQNFDLDWVIKTSERISHDQETKLSRYEIDKIPFQGAGNNTIDYDDLDLKIIFEKEITSDEFSKSYQDFLKLDNVLRLAYIRVIKKVIENGIPENHANKLIDAHPDYEDMDYVVFGFMTNSEIIAVATYDKDKKQLFFDKRELERALDYYENGDCGEYLGDNYLQ
jgi:hypothetical protein